MDARKTIEESISEFRLIYNSPLDFINLVAGLRLSILDNTSRKISGNMTYLLNRIYFKRVPFDSFHFDGLH